VTLRAIIGINRYHWLPIKEAKCYLSKRYRQLVIIIIMYVLEI
jgi:hypothetical protein